MYWVLGFIDFTLTTRAWNTYNPFSNDSALSGTVFRYTHGLGDGNVKPSSQKFKAETIISGLGVMGLGLRASGLRFRVSLGFRVM